MRQDRIARLEALLARVNTRRAEPRPSRGDGAPAQAAVAEAAVATELDSDLLQSVPPPAVTSAVEPVPADSGTLESRERLVAAASSSHTTDEATEADAIPPVRAGEGPVVHAASDDAPEIEVATAEVDVTGTIETEVEEEEPPVSSRRPIAVEPRLAELAFGEAPPPPVAHTPPPESGRQVAAPPVDLDFEGESTGVRTTPSAPPGPVARPAPSAVVPEVTRASLEGKGEVASFTGNVPVQKPSNLGELLDATLDL